MKIKAIRLISNQRDLMIIEIDGYFHQVLLIGKRCKKQQLKQMYFEVKELPIELTDLPNVFCRMHKFEQIPFYEDIKVDFITNTDTDRIYTPSY